MLSIPATGHMDHGLWERECNMPLIGQSEWVLCRMQTQAIIIIEVIKMRKSRHCDWLRGGQFNISSYLLSELSHESAINLRV